MKKILLSILLVLSLTITGCKKHGENYVIKEINKRMDSCISYYLEGTMELMNNEDIYEYDVKVSYKEKDFYKVELVNTLNNHEQVILRNNDGVYVVTPSLNKSFKFQSDWPYNNSQVYLLNSLLEDINNDETKTFTESKDGSIITTVVNYPNNQKLIKQKIHLDKNNNFKVVEVLDIDDNVQIKMKFNKINYKSDYKNDYFNLDNLISKEKDIKENQEPEDTKETAKIDDIIYPMYLPDNTYLTNQEKIDKDDGQRLILTFEGDSSFTLIEETISTSKEHEIIPTYGEIELISDSIAVVNDNSVNWISNGIEYYVVSDVIPKNELLKVARSVSVLPVSK